MWDTDHEYAKKDFLAEFLHSFESWVSARLKKVAAREALDMIRSSKEKAVKQGIDPIKPVHGGNRMQLLETVVGIEDAKDSIEFDLWLHVASIGNHIIFDIPLKKHKEFNKLANTGTLLKSVVILRNHVQFSFEIDTGPKKELTDAVGIDTGIDALASLSTGEQYGTDIKDCIERIKRCDHDSKGQQKATRALKQRIDEVAKQVVAKSSVIVVENLKNITQGTKLKRRLSSSMRRSIGRWNVAYWLDRLEQSCEWNRVSFRTVSPRNTSKLCPICGQIDGRNRVLEKFRCLNCGHEDNADINAARNILNRFLTGPYGAGCKPLTLVNEI